MPVNALLYVYPLNCMGSLEHSACLGSSFMDKKPNWAEKMYVLVALWFVTAGEVTLLLANIPECADPWAPVIQGISILSRVYNCTEKTFFRAFSQKCMFHPAKISNDFFSQSFQNRNLCPFSPVTLETFFGSS